MAELAGDLGLFRLRRLGQLALEFGQFRLAGASATQLALTFTGTHEKLLGRLNRNRRARIDSPEDAEFPFLPGRARLRQCGAARSQGQSVFHNAEEA
jgi:hypothetical protein